MGSLCLMGTFNWVSAYSLHHEALLELSFMLGMVLLVGLFSIGVMCYSSTIVVFYWRTLRFDPGCRQSTRNKEGFFHWVLC